MAISNYGDLKSKASTYMFHQRFLADYDDATAMFEAVANRRLRVREMEAVAFLTTIGGEVALPTDYLVWRTVLPADRTRYPSSSAEIDYVHPAYLPVVGIAAGGLYARPQVFTIEGNLFKARPVNDAADAYEFHYYQKIPSLVGSDTNTNWLIQAHPDFVLEGVLTELFVLGRNVEGAQLHKARRDELLAEIIQLSALTTGPTSKYVRTAEYM